MKKISDAIWLWGQNPGSHHANKAYRLPGTNVMDSAAGCDFFGIKNCYRVRMKAGPFPPFDNESEKVKHLPNVVWSAVGAGGCREMDSGTGDLEEVLRQAEMYPNVSGAVLDDFFASVEGFTERGVIARYSLDAVNTMREKLHNFPKRRLDLHLVFYTYQLELPIAEYLPNFDIFTLWTWKATDLPAFPENLAKFKKIIPDRPVFAGCYLWDYGNAQPIPAELMKMQLEFYRQGLVSGDLQGVVICSNCCADIGLETVGILKDWLEENKDVVIEP